MKKTMSLILALIMALGVCTVAFAGGDGATNVTVTISDKGSLVVVNEIVSVTDVV